MSTRFISKCLKTHNTRGSGLLGLRDNDCTKSVQFTQYKERCVKFKIDSINSNSFEPDGSDRFRMFFSECMFFSASLDA